MPQKRNMPIIEKLLKCPNHYKNFFNCSVCGKHGHDLCVKIHRSVHVPYVVVGGCSLQYEVLHFQDLTVRDTPDKGHLLSATKAQEYTETENILFRTLKHYSPSSKVSHEEQSPVNVIGSLDKGNMLLLRRLLTVPCNSYGAECVI
jgi:hypothetical protein